ncbi:MAG TPA: DUF6454 family protein [Bryobacteraceae bacterium]|nr:DUF6454 family protein [Bryobacteraceae bacterium]
MLLCAATAGAQTPEQVIGLKAETHHVQGVAVIDGRFLVTSVERKAGHGWLMEFDGGGKQMRAVQIQNGAMFHPGGFDIDDTSVWIPVAEYRPKSRSRIERRSLESFELISSFDVPDHIGALALGPDRMFLVNWDARQFYEYTLDGKLMRVRDNPLGHRFQDLKYRYGALIGSAPAAKGAAGGFVVWLDPETLLVTEERAVGRTDRGVSLVNEGLDVRDGWAYLLPEDAPSRIFVLDLMKWSSKP